MRIPLPIKNASPPTKAQIDDNRARLRRVAEIEDRQVRPPDIAELIGFLDPAIEVPPPEVERLPEGYAQEEAARVLRKMGNRAKGPLVNAIKNAPTRTPAFIILAAQGFLEAFDTAFKLPDADNLAHLSVLYLPYHGPTDLPTMRSWYQRNREHLVRDANTGRLRLDRR